MRGARAGRLLGREAELARLEAHIRDDRPAVIIGEAGIGKTTLLRAAVEASGRRAFEIGGLAILAGRPYAALRRLVGGPIDGDAEYVASAIEGRVGPDALIVDDVQWLDDASRSVVALLVPRIAVVAAIRSGGPEAGPAIAFAESIGIERINLGPLDVPTAAALATRIQPSLSTAEARRVAARAGGNPFFVVELAAAKAPSAGTDVVIRLRLADLSPAGRSSARILAVLGRPATIDELGPGTDDLVRAGLVAPEGKGRFAFQHQLLGDHVLGAMAPAGLAATRLEAAGRTPDRLEAARLYAAAGATERCATAAAEAEATATTTGDRIAALQLRAASSSGAAAPALRIEAAAQLVEVHDYAAAGALLDGLAGWDGLSTARLDAIRGKVTGILGNLEEARATVARATAAVTPLVEAGDRDAADVLVDVLATDAQVRTWAGDPAAGLAVAERAVTLADAFELPGARARTLLGYLLVTADRPHEALAHLRAALENRRSAGDGPGELQALNVLLLAEMSVSGTEPALLTCRQLDVRAAELHLFANRRGYLPYLVFLLDAAGRYREALEVAEESAIAPLAARAAIYGPTYAALANARLGRFEAARSTIAQIEERRADDPEAERLYLDIAGTIELAQGRPAHALRHYEALIAFPQKSESDRLEPQVNAMWARYELGREPGPPIDPGPTPRVAGVGPESTGLGLLDGGRFEGAVAAFDAAVEAWAPFLTWNADRCRWAAGEALRLAGARDAAIERLTEAERIAIDREARPQLSRVQRSLRLLGVRRAAPRSASGADLLTAREQELMALVAAGHNNVEIGRRLGLGRGTVHRLLSSAMLKLGAETRSQAVALVDAG